MACLSVGQGELCALPVQGASSAEEVEDNVRPSVPPVQVAGSAEEGYADALGHSVYNAANDTEDSDDTNDTEDSDDTNDTEDSDDTNDTEDSDDTNDTEDSDDTEGKEEEEEEAAHSSQVSNKSSGGGPTGSSGTSFQKL
jgi:hypothetical protein